MIDASTAFKSLSPDKWKVEQVIVFDWYDWPRRGFCKMAQPATCFYFEVLADAYSEEDTDDHLYQISSCDTTNFDEVIQIFTTVDQPRKPIWIPSNNSNLSADDEREIAQIISQVKPTDIVIQSRNMLEFSRCWVKAH